jgi:pimeloyl-ACP methyl ester carboxylesterase
MTHSQRDQGSTEQTVAAQLEAIVRWGGSPTADAAVRLQRISQPVLVVNGKSDVMVPTINSFALFQQLPNARLSLYPDSGHGALFQYADAFVREGLQFLEN